MTTYSLTSPTLNPLAADRRPSAAAPSAVVYRRRRLVVGAFAILAFVLLGAVLSAGVASLTSSKAAADGPAAPATVHVVQPGESVWSIAEALTAPGADVRATVDVLRAANGGTTLGAGDRILIPGQLGD